jgi:hypothetical protein
LFEGQKAMEGRKIMMRKITIFILVLSIILLGTIDVVAESVTLTPDKALRINFYTLPPLNPVPDTFVLGLGDVGANKYTSMRGSIYNGDTLLGVDTYDDHGDMVGALSVYLFWKSPESEFTFTDPGVIDFSSIRNGTINGRIDYTIQTGSMTIDLTRVRLIMWDAYDAYSGHNTYPDPIITSKSIVSIPEPATLLLLGLGAAILRKRKG